MTHMPNYGFDRLAPYTFESVVKMVKCWTNLDLVTKPPKELADVYFDMFPEETAAIWGVRIFSIYVLTRAFTICFDFFNCACLLVEKNKKYLKFDKSKSMRYQGHNFCI